MNFKEKSRKCGTTPRVTKKEKNQNQVERRPERNALSIRFVKKKTLRKRGSGGSHWKKKNRPSRRLLTKERQSLPPAFEQDGGNGNPRGKRKQGTCSEETFGADDPPTEPRKGTQSYNTALLKSEKKRQMTPGVGRHHEQRAPKGVGDICFKGKKGDRRGNRNHGMVSPQQKVERWRGGGMVKNYVQNQKR